MASDEVATVRALVGCGLGAFLVVAHYAVAAAVIARPMVASTPEGLVWQKALLAQTMRPLPVSALADATFTAAIALYVAFLARADLPLPALVLGGVVALLTVPALVAAVIGQLKLWLEPEPPRVRETSAP